MVASSVGIVLGVVPLFTHGPIQVSAFILPPFLSKRLSVSIGSPSPSRGTKSPLAYGIRDDNDEKKDLAAPSSQFSTNDFQKQMENELDPACSIEDEDCLAFSSLDDQPLVFKSNTNEDPLCDPQDVDCQAFLPKTYLNFDTYLATELKTRSSSIERERIDHNWRTAHCPTTFVSVSNSDWVRRVHMETYPIAVCGGARGGVYVVNLEEQNVIGNVEGAHIVQVEPRTVKSAGATMARQAMNKLYGKLDGGGVVAVAIHGDLVASSGREGGVRLWKVVETGKERSSKFEHMESVATGKLIPLGSLPGLQNTIATSIEFDSNGLIWTGCYDGTVHAFNTTKYATLNVQKPVSHDQLSQESVGFEVQFQSDFTDSVMDIDLCEELKLGVCATADGGAALFNMEDGQFFVGIMLFEVAARSALIMKHKDETGYSVLCGGMDGTIHRIPLNINPTTGKVDEENPFLVSETTETAIKPRHVGPVMCMTAAAAGVFISGGQDGALRVWDCSDTDAGTETEVVDKQQLDHRKLQTKCMYALTGYKLWLGSACTDGKHLVSDGGENSVIVRDYSREPGTNGKASL